MCNTLTKTYAVIGSAYGDLGPLFRPSDLKLLKNNEIFFSNAEVADPCHSTNALCLEQLYGCLFQPLYTWTWTIQLVTYSGKVVCGLRVQQIHRGICSSNFKCYLFAFYCNLELLEDKSAQSLTTPHYVQNRIKKETRRLFC